MGNEWRETAMGQIIRRHRRHRQRRRRRSPFFASPLCRRGQGMSRSGLSVNHEGLRHNLV